MKHENFKSLVAVMVAIVTVLGASAACLASAAVSNASAADFSGLDASIRAQKADIINNIYAYEHYRAYTSYVRYDELGRLMFDPNADNETALRNGALQSEAWGVASGLTPSFFNPRYLNSDGQYDLERELQEAWAQDSQDQDLDAEPYFIDSDRFRVSSSYLTADMIVFAVSFWFFTLAQATEKNIKYLWAGLGVVAALAGVIGIFIGRAAG